MEEALPSAVAVDPQLSEEMDISEPEPSPEKSVQPMMSDAPAAPHFPRKSAAVAPASTDPARVEEASKEEATVAPPPPSAARPEGFDSAAKAEVLTETFSSSPPAAAEDATMTMSHVEEPSVELPSDDRPCPVAAAAVAAKLAVVGTAPTAETPITSEVTQGSYNDNHSSAQSVTAGIVCSDEGRKLARDMVADVVAATVLEATSSAPAEASLGVNDGVDPPMNDASDSNSGKPPENVTETAADADSAQTNSEECVAETVSSIPDADEKKGRSNDEEKVAEEKMDVSLSASGQHSDDKGVEAVPTPPKTADDSKESANSKPAALASNGDTKLPATAPHVASSIASEPPSHQPVQNFAASAAVMQPNNPQGRELKVEDALLYLDQVKLVFGDRPRIYNQFLEIMKNFKAQEVDTVGVINSVRKLFHGYNSLILGFNTFLPEGYKIELRDSEPVFLGPGLPGTQ